MLYTTTSHNFSYNYKNLLINKKYNIKRNIILDNFSIFLKIIFYK